MTKRLNRETRVGKHPTKGFYFSTQEMMKFVKSPKFGTKATPDGNFWYYTVNKYKEIIGIL